MIRVVLDTNIVVSALLQPLGPPAQIFELALAA
jgi:predicted nucleic acid-binding protein